MHAGGYSLHVVLVMSFLHDKATIFIVLIVLFLAKTVFCFASVITSYTNVATNQ